MKQTVAVTVMLAGLWWFFLRQASPVLSASDQTVTTGEIVRVPSEPMGLTASSHFRDVKPILPTSVVSGSAATAAPVPAKPQPSVRQQPGRYARHFTVDADGIAVIDGDIALGVPPPGQQAGLAAVPNLSPWPTRFVPYFIQADLKNPERVYEALRMFTNTAVRFIPYTDQDDVLVFQEAEGACKSYVGKVGGKQSIWISEKCGHHEVAHELMHALGFIHEQNRSDRDSYIKINPDSIDDKYRINFEKMPPEFMQLSGLAEFSFDSIMIYPPTMFSRNALATMSPIKEGQRILPSEQLSDRDKDRIDRYYGTR